MKTLAALAVLGLLAACSTAGGPRTDWSCDGGAAFSSRFKSGRAEIFAGGQLYTLRSVESGSGAWRALAWAYQSLADLRFGDFDGDRITDVFTVSPRPDGGNQWLYSPGGAGDWTDLAWSYESLADLRLGDLDGDGLSDVFTASPRADVGYQWWYSPRGRDNWISRAWAYQTISDLRLGDVHDQP